MQNGFREIHNNIIFKRYSNPNFHAHLHEDIELLYVIRGGGNVLCNGQKYELKARDFFIAFPNQIHHLSGFALGEYILVVINPSRLLSFANMFLEGEPVSSVVSFGNKPDDNIVFLLEMALSEYMRDGYSTVIEAYLTTFFGKLLKYYEIKNISIPCNKVLQILDHCSRHYKENISVDDVANAFDISRSTVSHIFSKQLKIGFCDYINSLRLVDAARLLRNTDMSITDIAQNAGFETIRTFNRAFLKEHAISPSQYRKQQKEYHS